jgi:hypothetical protein
MRQGNMISHASTLLSAATVTGAGTAFARSDDGKATYQAAIAGTGAVSATVVIEVSNDSANWITLGTITLSGTTSATDGFASNAVWLLNRANVTAISGTNAAVTVTKAS